MRETNLEEITKGAAGRVEVWTTNWRKEKNVAKNFQSAYLEEKIKNVPIHILSQPLFQVSLALPVAEVVDQDDAVGIGVEHVAGVAVGVEATHIVQL